MTRKTLVLFVIVWAAILWLRDRPRATNAPPNADAVVRHEPPAASVSHGGATTWARLPSFVWAVACLTAVWLAQRIGRSLIAGWRQFRLNRRYAGLGLRRMWRSVQTADGRLQPKGLVFPDSTRLAFPCVVSPPNDPTVFPLRLELKLIQPDGRVWCTQSRTMKDAAAESAKVRFEFGDLAGMLAVPGVWKVRLVLADINKVLGCSEFRVVGVGDLVASLEVSDATLAAVRGNEVAAESVILPDVQKVVPSIVIRTGAFAPSKFRGIDLRLALVNHATPDKDVESQSFPLEFSGGRMEFCGAALPIAGRPIAREPGHWAFRFVVGDRELARLPFQVASREHVLAGLKIVAFDVEGVDASGEAVPLGTTALIEGIRLLRPKVRLSNPLPTGRIAVQAEVIACVNGDPRKGTHETLTLDRSDIPLASGEFETPRLAAGEESVEVLFILYVEGRELGRRVVALETRPIRVAAEDGTIASVPGLDYDAEAERILSQASVAG